ncbi:hypothetical protein C455_11923 [Haloferax larsenii JCM 13917]|nr:hypothetical protein [Haloferax larsenii]ELZ78390.1 hypothetical protein C455_11923 [Haloferax larsenii JCM 13917]
MTQTPSDSSVSFADSIVSTCRPTLGDALRSVIYFTREDFDLLYVRQDLYGGDEEKARAVKAGLVESERTGFGPQEAYGRETHGESTPEFGEYEFTLRVFSEGFIGRVVVGDHGVIVTTDELELSEFEEMEVALGRILEANWEA